MCDMCMQTLARTFQPDTSKIVKSIHELIFKGFKKCTDKVCVHINCYHKVCVHHVEYSIPLISYTEISKSISISQSEIS